MFALHAEAISHPNRRLTRLFRALAAATAFLTSAGVYAADEVTIGISAPQSGGGAEYGSAFVDGAKLAVKDLRDEITVGGKKFKLKLAICDDEFKSDKAANCARRLVSQDGARIVINPGTYATVPVLSFNQDKGSEFLVLGASGDPSVTARGNKLFVRTWNNASRTMPGYVDNVLAYIKANKLDIKKAALMEVNTDFGAAWVNNFKKEWEKQGNQIVGRVVYDSNGTDFYAQLTPLLANKPDIIILTTVCEPSSLVIKQARELGYKGTFMNHGGCTGAQMLKLLPAADVDGMLFEGSPWSKDSPELAQFRKDFAAAFKAEPQIISAGGYLNVLWLARAMEAANTTSDPAAIRAAMPKALESLKPNLLGWSNLDEAGDTVWPMHVSFIKGGSTQNFTQP